MIAVLKKNRPFSHMPGITCLIPGTCAEISCFPTLLRIARKWEYTWNVSGPVQDFTAQVDLERNCVFIFGKAQEGFFRLRIAANDSGFTVVQKKEPIHFPSDVKFFIRPKEERLFLGSHKAQEWEMMVRRFDLREMLPLLFAIGQKIPPIPTQPLTGCARLLELPKDRLQLPLALTSFLKASFTQMFIPRLTDDQHQGLIPDEPVSGNRFFLIQEGAKMIRSLFFRQDERRLSFLPQLPVPFDQGKMAQISAPGIGEIDFDWSKKLLRQMVIRADTSGEVVFEFQKEIKSYRVRMQRQEKGYRFKSSDPLLLEKGSTYLIDRFEK